MIDVKELGNVDYEVQDFVAIEPKGEAHYCLIPKQVDQAVILKLQKIAMDIGNHNVDKGNCNSYETVMKFVNKHPVVELFINKED